jgi:CoA:oxalate CoA-transferase
LEKVLQGIKVLDFTWALAGPWATRLLADCGARVIKVEPLGGVINRTFPPIKQGQSAWFMYTNWGKKSICIDLKQDEGKELALELGKVSDVVVENFRPGVMKELGLDYTAFQKVNPAIIMCSISGFGQYGPLSQQMCADTSAQAYSGLLDLTGEPDQTPVFFGTSIGDTSAGTYSFGAICAALYKRTLTGEGAYIDIALVDCLFSQHEFAVGYEVLTNGQQHSRRAGHHHQALSPLGVHKGRDGYIIINCFRDEGWSRLAEIMGKPELAKDPRFDTGEHRAKNRKEITIEIEEWLQNFESVKDVAALLQSYRILATPVMTVQELMEDPQIQAREMLVEFSHPILGRIKALNSPFRFTPPAACINGLPPITAGQHTVEILSNVLNFNSEKIKYLLERKIVSGEDRNPGTSDR